MSAAGTVLVFGAAGPAFVDPTALPVPQPADLAALQVSLAAALKTVDALSARIAALEARTSNVTFSGSLPIATLQVGTTTFAVPVAGLLATDRVSVQPAADLPAGMSLAWARPKAAGVLSVAVTALAVVAVKSPVALMVTALR